MDRREVEFVTHLTNNADATAVVALQGILCIIDILNAQGVLDREATQKLELSFFQMLNQTSASAERRTLLGQTIVSAFGPMLRAGAAPTPSV